MAILASPKKEYFISLSSIPCKFHCSEFMEIIFRSFVSHYEFSRIQVNKSIVKVDQSQEINIVSREIKCHMYEDCQQDFDFVMKVCN